MKNFIVYDNNTGAILRTGQCQDAVFELQASEGESVIEGVADDEKQRVDIHTKQVVPK